MKFRRKPKSRPTFGTAQAFVDGGKADGLGSEEGMKLAQGRRVNASSSFF